MFTKLRNAEGLGGLPIMGLFLVAVIGAVVGLH